jgi:hypothetical protein
MAPAINPALISPSNHLSKFGPYGPFREGGFTAALLPTMPPGAEISAKSGLEGAKRKAEQARVEGLMANRGKIPGHCYHRPGPRYQHGLWGGFAKFTQHITTDANLEEWASWGGGVSLLARHFPAVDIDVTHADAAAQIHQFTISQLGAAPARWGNDPKVLLMYRTATPMKKDRFAFTLPGSSDVHAVETMANGQQFVLAGIHPKTGRPYRFDGDQLPVADQLTEVTPKMVADLMAALRLFVVDVLGGEIVVGRLGRGVPRDAVERKQMEPVAALAADEIALRDALAKCVGDDLSIDDKAGSQLGDEFIRNAQAALADNWNAVQLINGASVHDSQLGFGGDCAKAGLSEGQAKSLVAALLMKAFEAGKIEPVRYQARLSDTRTVIDGYHRAYQMMAGSVVLLAGVEDDFGPLDDDGEPIGDAASVSTPDQEPTLKEVRFFNERTRRHVQVTALVGLPSANDNERRPTPTRFTAAQLGGMEFDPVKFVVPGYFAEGLTLFAGKPKIGKSWLMLDITLQVAAGGEVLGVKVQGGDVLYAALEDNARRLKDRLGMISPFTDLPANLTFWTEMPLLDDGGLAELEKWIAGSANPALIVIDTLAKVRSSKRKDETNYEADYKALSGLQRLAIRSGIAIIVVHHTRKAEAEDALEAVSGTNGLTGSADSIVVLNRTKDGTSLYGRGRDIEEFEVSVELNLSTCRWAVLGEASAVRMTTERPI